MFEPGSNTRSPGCVVHAGHGVPRVAPLAVDVAGYLVVSRWLLRAVLEPAKPSGAGCDAGSQLAGFAMFVLGLWVSVVGG